MFVFFFIWENIKLKMIGVFSKVWYVGYCNVVLIREIYLMIVKSCYNIFVYFVLDNI